MKIEREECKNGERKDEATKMKKSEFIAKKKIQENEM